MIRFSEDFAELMHISQEIVGLIIGGGVLGSSPTRIDRNVVVLAEVNQ